MKKLLLSLFALLAFVAVNAQAAKTKVRPSLVPVPEVKPISAAEQKKKDEQKVIDYQKALDRKAKAIKEAKEDKVKIN